MDRRKRHTSQGPTPTYRNDVNRSLSEEDEQQKRFERARVHSRTLARLVSEVRDPMADSARMTELEFERQSTRKSYLHLLFRGKDDSSVISAIGDERRLVSTHSTSSASVNLLDVVFPEGSDPKKFSEESLSALNFIWQDTSHAFISLYRARVALIEKQIQIRNHSRRGKSDSTEKRPLGPVALRKLLAAYKEFLLKESEFYSRLIVKISPSLSDRQFTALKSSLTGVLNLTRDTPPSPRPVQKVAEVFIQRLLICYGDILRYRQLCQTPQLRDFGPAAQCYLRARALNPHNGNPSNQLAVLSTYAGDTLETMYYYYRALTVALPFPTAENNLRHLAQKEYRRWRAEPDDDEEDDRSDMSAAPTAADFRRLFITLYSIVFLSPDDLDRPRFERLTRDVGDALYDVLDHCLLPAPEVEHVCVLALCSVYLARLRRASEADDLRIPLLLYFERIALQNVFLLFSILAKITKEDADNSVLFSLGGVEKAESREERAVLRKITPVIRRTTPSLRILIHWIRTQTQYVSRARARFLSSEANVAPLAQAQSKLYAHMIALFNSLSVAFPMDQLGVVDEQTAAPLEEDLDLIGFAPFRVALKANSQQLASQQHPNEDALRRIASIHRMAVAIATSDALPITLINGKYTAVSGVTKQQAQQLTSGSPTSPTLSGDGGVDIEPEGHSRRQRDEGVTSDAIHQGEAARERGATRGKTGDGVRNKKNAPRDQRKAKTQERGSKEAKTNGKRRIATEGQSSVAAQVSIPQDAVLQPEATPKIEPKADDMDIQVEDTTIPDSNGDFSPYGTDEDLPLTTTKDASLFEGEDDNDVLNLAMRVGTGRSDAHPLLMQQQGSLLMDRTSSNPIRSNLSDVASTASYGGGGYGASTDALAEAGGSGVSESRAMHSTPHVLPTAPHASFAASQTNEVSQPYSSETQSVPGSLSSQVKSASKPPARPSDNLLQLLNTSKLRKESPALPSPAADAPARINAHDLLQRMTQPRPSTDPPAAAPTPHSAEATPAIDLTRSSSSSWMWGSQTLPVSGDIWKAVREDVPRDVSQVQTQGMPQVPTQGVPQALPQGVPPNIPQDYGPIQAPFPHLAPSLAPMHRTDNNVFSDSNRWSPFYGTSHYQGE